MDPVTTAIIAALTAGAISGVTETSKKAIVDAYEGLKKILRQKFGKKSEIIQAVNLLEKKPDSTGRQETLKEEVARVKAEKDEEILLAAQEILTLIQNNSNIQHTQTAIGNYIAQADRNSSATVNVTNPKNTHGKK
jgi:hypothetical protein